MIFVQNLLELTLEAAPWLVLGLAMGGLMKALIPTSFLQRHLSGNSFASIGKATILGAPLPLCSCGVIPVALGLRQAGASKPATAAFLVSTPETGVDSMTVTYALMGPFMAIVRPVSALVSAFVSGSLVALFDKESDHKTVPVTDSSTRCCSSNDGGDRATVIKACCDSESEDRAVKASGAQLQDETETECCSTTAADRQTNEDRTGWIAKGWSGIHYAFTRLLDDIIFWLVIGMLFAAASKTFLPGDFLAQWGQGFLAMLVMVVAGIPMYICATASTPVAAGLLMAGVSPGVALVLLLTGPATNVSTLGVISKELGQRSMWLYLTGVIVTALIAGLTVNGLIGLYQIDIQTQVNHNHSGLPQWLRWASLLLLFAIVARKWPSALFTRSQPEGA